MIGRGWNIQYRDWQGVLYTVQGLAGGAIYSTSIGRGVIYSKGLAGGAIYSTRIGRRRCYIQSRDWQGWNIQYKDWQGVLYIVQGLAGACQDLS